MARSRPVLISLLGGGAPSPAEALVMAAREAATLDSLEQALSTGAFDAAILAADASRRRSQVPEGVIIDGDEGPFHFGRRLLGIIEAYELERPLYFGGGALPLLARHDWREMARRLEEAERLVITNNPYSSDLVGFVPGQALRGLQLPAGDNSLARLLAELGGLPLHTLPRRPATQLDIDTPADLCVLSLGPDLGPRLAAVLAAADLDTSIYRSCLSLLINPQAQVLVAGRIGSHTWQYLERYTACRMRVLAEERGMIADGAYRQGFARSILGFYLERVGVSRFFATLADLGDAAFIDTRVLLAHLRLRPSQADRFYSDIGRVEAIRDPFLRAFTGAAREAPIPVVLGGHSLVSGGLMLLAEIARQRAGSSDAGQISWEEAS